MHLYQNTKPSRRSIIQAALAAAAALGVPMSFSTQALARQNAAGKLPIGMNLAGIADWENSYPFINLIHGARTWLTKLAEGGGPWNTDQIDFIELDADGYPLEIPANPPGQPPQKVATILPNRAKAGQYVLLYDGEGEFGVGGRTRIVSQVPGRVVLTMDHNGRTEGDNALEMIEILKSTRGNHVRNIRIVPIENEKTDLKANPFIPEILDFCKPFHCLRFMDWQETNNSSGRFWKDRKTTTFYNQRGQGGDVAGLGGKPFPASKLRFTSGCAIEYCIQLCNLTKTDGWFCVPHLADDEYLTEMAKLIKSTLDPSLKCYIEFSNEVWNWQFQQAQVMLRSKVAADLLKERNIKAWKDEAAVEFNDFGVAIKGEGDNFPERMAMLQMRTFNAFRAVFDGDSRSRLVCVGASQQAWFDVVNRTLRLVMENGGCDAFSVAGYFGPDRKIYDAWDAKGAAITVDDIIADMKVVVETDSKKQIEDVGNLTKKHDVLYLVYEGGQHLQPRNQADGTTYATAMAESQKHPGMYDCYKRNFELHIENGCDLFMAFASVGRQGTRWGSWGHLEYYGQDPVEMPKMQALLDFNTAKN
jgi:hypothetical protein